MVQGLNNEASKVSQESWNEETKSSEENDKKRMHWSGAQMQGFQTCTHVQHSQDTNINDQEKQSKNRFYYL